ncbi:MULTISPECIES: 2-isopropylmalate synthase [Thioalkalivibrio]|uniref:2-isopropylmalate synthase n=1 Tax=Thioalkalivibrio halophilus TaxID=252474 RepID=A0A1V3A2G9_9GAMM|nr:MULTISPECIES: 2-isopropylmalate synthase [Thioalkalivibrio]OOC11489.1 2-isopropylmalate synthase [Thioalkalivibrio halophilus]PYG00822.1 2-isopropylmalate synthase [Thioalkalivibrio sp. ALE21]
MSFDHTKYAPFPPIDKADRRWPAQRTTAAPRFCAVDLRDGNQALVHPMSVEQKMRFFEVLVDIGLKEIEIGFPAASQIDFDFTRRLVDEQRIPEGVYVQVLTQAREDLIARTFEALEGAPRAVVHVYNSTNPAQREQVFRMDRDGIRGIAENGARWVRDYAAKYPQTDWIFQYSPESFSTTELDYAVEVVDAVTAIWRPDRGQKVVINLPATVESATPNVFADQVEWFCDHVQHREHICVSLHTHNDRGTGVAAAELGLLAGADRLEGTLFGNGERTGNMDLVTVGMNLYSQGIDPTIDLSDMERLMEVYKECTDMPIHPRHPWAGELVYTAFSGSHQDAIRKGLAHYREHGGHWNVPYLPIDPGDLGRRYEEVVRINSQSGKGGVTHVLERDYGIELPRWLAVEFARIVQQDAEASGEEVTSQRIHELFEKHYLAPVPGWDLVRYEMEKEGPVVRLDATVGPPGQETRLNGAGHGAVEALAEALHASRGVEVRVSHFDEHAVEAGTEARAMAAVDVSVDGERSVGVALGEDTTAATLQAVLNAAGRRLGHEAPRIPDAVMAAASA